MKPRLFIDTNIMLDLLGERIPYYEAAARVATLAEKKEVQLFVSSLSFATVNYFLTKYENATSAKNKLLKFKTLTRVCDLLESTIDKGLSSNFHDFEDALQYFSALDASCHIIITRNGKDFKASKIPVMTAEEYLMSRLKN